MRHERGPRAVKGAGSAYRPRGRAIRSNLSWYGFASGMGVLRSHPVRRAVRGLVKELRAGVKPARKNEVMAAFGGGSQLWSRCRPVPRSCERCGDLSDFRGTSLGIEEPTDPGDEGALAELEPTRSSDLERPEGSIGVSCWVPADTLGEAAQVGHDVVLQTCTTVTGRTHEPYDPDPGHPVNARG
jgi:hypothetical protein